MSKPSQPTAHDLGYVMFVAAAEPALDRACSSAAGHGFDFRAVYAGFIYANLERFAMAFTADEAAQVAAEALLDIEERIRKRDEARRGTHA